MLMKPEPIKLIVVVQHQLMPLFNQVILIYLLDKAALGQATGTADLRGDGEFIMSMKRFIPDFKVLTGNSKVTLLLNNYPNDTASSSPLGPFTITSSTDKSRY